LSGYAGNERPHPSGLNLRGLDAGVLERFVCRFDDQILFAFIPVLAEFRATHSDDRYTVAEVFHAISPFAANLTRLACASRTRKVFIFSNQVIANRRGRVNE